MNIYYANNFFKRLKGLLFTKEIKEENALLLKNCSQVHSFGMNYDIGVYYLDKNYKVISYEYLKRNKMGKRVKNTKHILEVHPNYVNKDNSKIIEEELMKEVQLNGRSI